MIGSTTTFIQSSSENTLESNADLETDEVYAQITLLPEADQTEITSPDSPLPEPQSCNVHSFCKTLTASDTSTHGGFSVLRRHADDCLPALESSKIPIKSAFVDLYIDFHKNRHIVFYCCRWCLVLTSSFLFQNMSQHSHPGRNWLQLIFVAMNGTFVTYFVVSIMLLLHGASNFNGAKYSITDNVGNLVAIALFSLLSALYV